MMSRVLLNMHESFNQQRSFSSASHFAEIEAKGSDEAVVDEAVVEARHPANYV